MTIIRHTFSLCAMSLAANAFTMQLPNPSYNPRISSLNSVDSRIASGTTNPAAMSSYRQPRITKDVIEEVDQIIVQGGSLRTCAFDEGINRVTVMMKTEGRPLNANVDLWQGPDNTPQKMSIYLEDGSKRLFRAIVETPGSSNAVSIRNTAQLEYPLTCGMEIETDDSPAPMATADYRIVQGGAVYTLPFAPEVQSIKVSLKTDGRPMNARVELLQGPNNNKEILEVYTEDGLERPLNLILDSPGVGNVVRIVNTATVEFPISASLEPYIIDASVHEGSSGSGMTWR